MFNLSVFSRRVVLCAALVFSAASVASAARFVFRDAILFTSIGVDDQGNILFTIFSNGMNRNATSKLIIFSNSNTAILRGRASGSGVRNNSGIRQVFRNSGSFSILDIFLIPIDGMDNQGTITQIRRSRIVVTRGKPRNNNEARLRYVAVGSFELEADD